MKTFNLLALLLISSLLFANENMISSMGEIQGRVVDENNEPVAFANISVERNGNIITGAASDDNGHYSIKLAPGTYTLKASAINYKVYVVENIVAQSERITFHDITLLSSSIMVDTFTYIWRQPVVDVGDVNSGSDVPKFVTRGLQKMEDIAATRPGIYQKDSGGPLQSIGTREGSTAIYMDDVRIYGNFDIPSPAISHVKVTLTGISARFGDVLGGVIEISTVSY